MDLRFWRKSQAAESPNASQNVLTKTQHLLKKIVVKAVGLTRAPYMSRDELVDPEYNLHEIKRAAAADSYIRNAVNRYSYMIFKAGFKYQSDNEKAMHYIKKRFKIMRYATGTPIETVFQEVADDLVKYSNAFLVKARTKNTFPGIKMKGVYKNDPVGGYFRLDPTTIRIKRNKNGTVLKYIQHIDGEEKQFSPVDVIHFYIDKEADHAFGTPRIAAALEDVKLLRKLEGIAVAMIYRFAIPLVQMIVGLKDAGMGATDPEINDARKEIENMSLDGILVTSERAAFKVVGAEGNAIQAAPYLKYFEERVFTALSMSAAQMGRGGSKQDADSMEALSHDIVKYIQRAIKINIENHMIGELLLEGGFNPITEEKDNVEFIFHEISLETKIKLENHEMLKFQSDMISFEEMRRNLGKDEQVDEDRLFTDLIKTKAAIKEIEAKERAANRGNGTVANTTNKDVKTRSMPRNQHGQRLAPKIREGMNDALNRVQPVKDNRSIYQHQHLTLYFLSVGEEKESWDSFAREVHAFVRDPFEEGYFVGLKDADAMTDVPSAAWDMPSKKALSPLYKYIDQKLRRIKSDADQRVKTGRSETLLDAYETLRYRVDYLFEFIGPKAFWIGYLQAGKVMNIPYAVVQFDGSDDELEYPDIVPTAGYLFKEIPPFHSFCGCTLRLEKKVGEKM